jgi:hypothetical protein
MSLFQNLLVLILTLVLYFSLSNSAFSQPTTPPCGYVNVVNNKYIDGRYFEKGIYVVNAFGISCAEIIGNDGLFALFLSLPDNSPLPTPWTSLSEAVGEPKFSAGTGIGFRVQKISELIFSLGVLQNRLKDTISTDLKASNAIITVGASSDGGETTKVEFTSDENVIITAKIYPDARYVGQEGELYIVMRTTENGKKVYMALNEDGVWEYWNTSLKSLSAAKYVEALKSAEEIAIYSGRMTVGQRLIYIGYSLFTDDKPVITTNLTPYKIDINQ